MITLDTIENLAELSRIELAADEKETLRKDLDAILGYVTEVQKIASVEHTPDLYLSNVMRADVVTNEPTTYTENLLNNAPLRQGQYVKVKKILE